MNNILKSLVLALVVVLPASCATVSLDRVTNFKANALNRAALELACPASQIHVSLIPHDADGALAVQGCGKLAIFLYSQAGSWINDSGAILDSGPISGGVPGN